MEFKIDESYAKNFNKWKMKEETSKKTKNLKRTLKELEESDSSSSESDEDARESYVRQVDELLRGLETGGVAALTKTRKADDVVGKKGSKENTMKAHKPLYGKELNERILKARGDDDEAYLRKLDEAARMDNNEIVKEAHKIDFAAFCDFDGELFTPAKTEREIKVEDDIDCGVKDGEASDDSKEQSDVDKVENSAKGSLMALNIGRHEDTMRAKASKRKEKRQERKERKQKDKEETLKKLKNIKLKELEEKYEKIKRINPDFIKHLTIEDLDEDFDSAKHDELMERLYKEEENCPIPDEKPVFSDDDIPTYSDCESDDNQIDSDNKVETIVTDDIKIKSKKSYFVNVDVNKDEKKTKVLYNPVEHGTFKEFVKKYPFNVNHDVIKGVDGDDTVCKFKYRAVDPQDFGLTFEEIILSKNKELNQWASLKKVVSIRSRNDEEKDDVIYHSERKLQKKRDILVSLYKDDSDTERKTEGGEESTTIKSKGSKKRLRKALQKGKLREMLSIDPISAADSLSTENVNEGVILMKKKKEKIVKQNLTIECSVSKIVKGETNKNPLPVEKVKVKKSKSKKLKIMPALESTRLQSYGVKEHYYRDLANKTAKRVDE